MLKTLVKAFSPREYSKLGICCSRQRHPSVSFLRTEAVQREIFPV